MQQEIEDYFIQFEYDLSFFIKCWFAFKIFNLH